MKNSLLVTIEIENRFDIPDVGKKLLSGLWCNINAISNIINKHGDHTINIEGFKITIKDGDE